MDKEVKEWMNKVLCCVCAGVRDINIQWNLTAISSEIYPPT